MLSYFHLRIFQCVCELDPFGLDYFVNEFWEAPRVNLMWVKSRLGCYTEEPIQFFGVDKVVDDDGSRIRSVHNRNPKPLNRQLSYEENFIDNKYDVETVNLAMNIGLPLEKKN